jgi:predicted nuclease of predicted toxin-antitoxin system
MKILLDHCVDWRLSRSWPNHVVKSAQEMGWDKLRNGRLLAAAAGEFDVLLTVDRNLKHQQNLAHLPIAVVVLISKSNRLTDLLALVPAIEAALMRLTPKTLVEVGS